MTQRPPAASPSRRRRESSACRAARTVSRSTCHAAPRAACSSSPTAASWTGASSRRCSRRSTKAGWRPWCSTASAPTRRPRSWTRRLRSRAPRGPSSSSGSAAAARWTRRSWWRCSRRGRQGLTDVYGIGLAEGPAAPAGGGADHGRDRLRGDAHRDRHDAGQREGGCRLAAAVPRRRGARQHPDAGAAAGGDRDDRRRRHGARDRGIYQQDGQEPALRYVRAARPADAPRQHRPRRAVRATMSTPASRCSSAR